MCSSFVSVCPCVGSLVIINSSRSSIVDVSSSNELDKSLRDLFGFSNLSFLPYGDLDLRTRSLFEFIFNFAMSELMPPLLVGVLGDFWLTGVAKHEACDDVHVSCSLIDSFNALFVSSTSTSMALIKIISSDGDEAGVVG